MVKLKTCSISCTPNILTIPCNHTDSVNEFNMVFKKYANLPDLPTTKSGAIRTPCYRPGIVLRNNNSCVELIVVDNNGCFRLQFGGPIKPNNASEVTVSGMQSFYSFKNELSKIGVDIECYAIEDGMEVKKSMPKPHIHIANTAYLNKTFIWVHHIDMHSSHPAGIIEFEPKFAPVLNNWYMLKESAKSDAERLEYKTKLNSLWGVMQSSMLSYRFANISKYALQRTNREVEKMANWLAKHDRLVLLYNTDGIWFAGERLPAEMQGDKIGEWSEDYNYCKFRAKSNGCYEFEGFNKKGEYIYKPVVRGLTKFDKIKPRSEWIWGDIYNDNIDKLVMYQVDRKKGIVEVYDEKNKI